jgi:hypothetical protein
MTPEWAAILRMHDQAILLMFAGVCAFALNWYVFERQPTVQKIFTWVALLSSVVILILEVIK